MHDSEFSAHAKNVRTGNSRHLELHACAARRALHAAVIYTRHRSRCSTQKEASFVRTHCGACLGLQRRVQSEFVAALEERLGLARPHAARETACRAFRELGCRVELCVPAAIGEHKRGSVLHNSRISVVPSGGAIMRRAILGLVVARVLMEASIAIRFQGSAGSIHAAEKQNMIFRFGGW